MATVNDVYAVTVQNQREIRDTPNKVWRGVTVSRTLPDGTKVDVPALQELADTKTAVLALRAELGHVKALVEQLQRIVLDLHPHTTNA